MDTYTLDHDITLICIPATSFPNGVMAAHQKIHEMFPMDGKRKYYGVSWGGGPGGSIIYKAAAEELQPGEADSMGCESFVIKKGKYISLIIHDYMKDLNAIGGTFQQMIALSDIDPEGACIEWYMNDKDLQCMVRLVS